MQFSDYSDSARATVQEILDAASPMIGDSVYDLLRVSAFGHIHESGLSPAQIAEIYALTLECASVLSREIDGIITRIGLAGDSEPTPDPGPPSPPVG